MGVIRSETTGDSKDGIYFLWKVASVMQSCVMHRFFCLVILFGFAWLPPNRSCAADFHLTDGTDLTGELASATDEGFVIRLTTGIFSPRIPWSRLTQETLKALAGDPKSSEFVEPYIEIPIDEKAKKKGH